MATNVNPITVVVSGPFLSELLFRNSCAQSDREGFLIGQEITVTTESINDLHIEEKREIFVNVYDIEPCQRLFSFYDNRGNINFTELEKLLESKKENIVGWYKFRRNSSATISLRERQIHKNLSALKSIGPFLFGLFTESLVSVDSTHDKELCFLQQSNKRFEMLKVKVVNLHGTEFAPYHHFNTGATDRTKGKLAEILKMPNDGDSGVRLSMSVIDRLQRALITLQRTLAEKEAEASNLEMDIKMLEVALS